MLMFASCYQVMIFFFPRLQEAMNVTMETDHIIVSNGQNECKILLPGITLQPDTCRGLKLVAGRELYFSIKGMCLKVRKCAV